MPLVELFTNIPDEDLSDEFVQGLHRKVSSTLGKPPGSVNVLVRGGQRMLKGGLSSPCIQLSIASVGVVGSAEQNREHITHLTGFLSEHLGVPTDRIVMRFQPLEPWQVGKDGKLLVDL